MFPVFLVFFGTTGDAAEKPVSSAEVDEDLIPPTREGGPENPEDVILVDGQGRCYYGGRGWYGGYGGYGGPLFYGGGFQG